jgi:5'(3')-deoxyribonucleotidase
MYNVSGILKQGERFMLNDHHLLLQKLNEMNKTSYIATILFDMDDVLADFGEAWLKTYNQKYNDTLTVNDLTDWDTSKVVKTECGMDIYELLKTPGIFRYIKPSKNSVEVISRLIENNFEIVIVSDSPEGHSHSDYIQDETNVSNPADDKRAWLREHFPMIPSKNVVFTSQKYRVYGHCLVDDKPATFEIFESLERDCILIDQPYNRYIKTDKRANNLLEAEKMIYQSFLK